jgi:hypothetical protein
MNNKKNLNESTIRRFWKLAGLRPINESPFYIEEEKEEEELEETASKEEEPMEEMAAKMKRDDEVDEMAKMKRDDLEEQIEEEDAMDSLDVEPEEGPSEEPGMEMGDVDAEVSVPESDVEALRAARDVIDQILSAADGADAGDEMDPEAPIEDEEMDLSDDEPEMAMEEENSFDETALEEMIESITAKVSKRLVKEALIKKLTK